MNRCVRLIAFLVMPTLSGCPTTPTKIPPPVVVSAKYRCLAAPSAAYQAGTVIRNVAGMAATAATVPADELTVAYFPTGPATFAGNYPDFEQKVSSGGSAALTAKKLEKLGITLNLSGSADYSVDLTAKNNTTYVSDDDVLLAVTEKMRAREGLIAGARYFFVKEAVGSQELTYIVSNKVKVEANAKLTADSSGLAVNLPLRDASNQLTSKKELIACVVLEEIDVRLVPAANGDSQLSLKRKTAPSDAESNALLSGEIKNK